mmetsp:Transcript_37947/g.68036  ORF Transcript_37947/g.68036 Transcript_37947/m.68036 type:complete len:228 (-) Transcript_37947:85-768(-)
MQDRLAHARHNLTLRLLFMFISTRSLPHFRRHLLVNVYHGLKAHGHVHCIGWASIEDDFLRNAIHSLQIVDARVVGVSNQRSHTHLANPKAHRFDCVLHEVVRHGTFRWALIDLLHQSCALVLPYNNHFALLSVLLQTAQVTRDIPHLPNKFVKELTDVDRKLHVALHQLQKHHVAVRGCMAHVRNFSLHVIAQIEVARLGVCLCHDHALPTSPASPEGSTVAGDRC